MAKSDKNPQTDAPDPASRQQDVDRPLADQAGFMGKRGHPPTRQPAADGQQDGVVDPGDTERRTRFDYDDRPLDPRRPRSAGSERDIEGDADDT